jgi:membrane associated rhomboid family serine protease
MSIINDLKYQYKTGGIGNKFIYWNVGLFLVSFIVFYNFKLGVFEYPKWLALSSDTTVFIQNPWTLFTYAFFHNGFLHLFFNMLVLNFTNRLFLTYFTAKQYMVVYVMSALFAGICFIASYFLLGKSSQIIGASGAIMGLLMAVTTYNPLLQIRLLLIGYVKLWHITAVFILLDLMQIQLENTGGHIAHLSGALFGFAFMYLLKKGFDLSKMYYNTQDGFVQLFKAKQKTPFKKVHVNKTKVTKIKASRIVLKDKTQQQIDEILDKISQSGYDSLTAEEKEFLFKSSK